ncbi:hypothetical protein LA76x_1425 [Lysobacter antibioticus]|uniref:Uncharacterized protein n=1 Tax=Lysobacter antibioticus TaxID=84531 RepID=A0A0S2F817_LYSAN|nr:hypothetical protein LA76x_1425 [Lysobacter antibioticus]
MPGSLSRSGDKIMAVSGQSGDRARGGPRRAFSPKIPDIGRS